MQSLAPGTKTYLMRFVIVAAASIAASWVGFFLLPQGASATLIWPPSAVGIAVLFLYGYDLWPAIVVSTLGVFLLRNGNVPLDLGIAVSNALEAFIGAYFLRRYVQLDPMLARLRDGLGLLVACITPTFVAALIITLTQYFLGHTSLVEVDTSFVALWIGHAVSALSFTPFLIRWLHRVKFTKTKNEVAEGVLLFGALSVFSYLAFWTADSAVGPLSIIYVLLIILIWASMRAGPRGTTLALALISAFGISGLLFGYEPVRNQQAMLGVQVLLVALDILFLLFVSIVEERKEAVVSLQQNVGQLQSALLKIQSEDQAKTNFLTILAHELRNPLAPIVTSVELMKSDPQAAIDPALVEIIEVHARTISLLLDDLLDISRITQSKFELRRERLPLRTAVDRSVESVRPLLNVRKHALEVSLPEGEVFLDADPVRFEQMLVNLLNNACKYTNPGGRITITASVEGGMAVLRVADNGIGIAKEKLPGIFEMFGQRGAELRAPGGLGVGLSLTKQLVELHGGTIEARSRGLGMGSAFTLRMPLSTGPATGAAATARSFVGRLRGLQQGPPSMRKILIVDDNEPAARGMAALLARSGYVAYIAQNGKDALEKIAQLTPYAVILDIGLPDINGYEVAAKIQKLHTRPQRLIALTGYGQEGDKAKSAEAGFDAHLIKPVSLADVEAVL
jgi:signal transduction histidine kinase/CheY-like chemotaxis protein